MPLTRKTSAPERAVASGNETKVADPQTAATQSPARSTGQQGTASAPPGRVAAGPVSYVGKPCTGLAGCPERSHLVARLWAAAETEIKAAETQLATTPDARSATVARRISALALTLDRLVALDRKAMAVPAAAAGEFHEHAITPPVDTDAWAFALAEKLDGGDAGDDRGADKA